MATRREIITLADKRLRLRSAPVTKVTFEVRALIEDMFETMYAAPGIGLAAIQIAIQTRIVTIDVGKKDDAQKPLALINPEVVWCSETRVSYEEGCLSIPDYYEEVERPSRVTVKYIDVHEREREIEADGLLATCLQHEIDHLNGVLFIDYISKLKRDRLLKKFRKVAKFEAK